MLAIALACACAVNIAVSIQNILRIIVKLVVKLIISVIVIMGTIMRLVAKLVVIMKLVEYIVRNIVILNIVNLVGEVVAILVAIVKGEKVLAKLTGRVEVTQLQGWMVKLYTLNMLCQGQGNPFLFLFLFLFLYFILYINVINSCLHKILLTIGVPLNENAHREINPNIETSKGNKIKINDNEVKNKIEIFEKTESIRAKIIANMLLRQNVE